MATAADTDFHTVRRVFAAHNIKNIDGYISKLANQKLDASGRVDWAYGKASLVKVVEECVPDGILPEGMSGALADVKISSRGPDDKVYDKHADLREKIPRGNTFLKLNGEPWRCVIYALKKFTGGMGDDDDRENGGSRIVWHNYFTRSHEKARRVVAIRKANGEAAHMSCVKIEEDYFICVGSKNVHMLVKTEDDIYKYVGPRYAYAADIAHTVFKHLNDLSEKKYTELLEFLSESRFTVVMEILNPKHQHVEDLSYLNDECALKFITWTSTNLEDSTDLCFLPPDDGLEIAKYLGFDTLENKIQDPLEAKIYMLQIRKNYGYEGEVLYYIDSENRVIGLLKKKTAWYIILRAIREQARNAFNRGRRPDSNETKTRIKRRLREIKSWLVLDEATIQKWQELGCSFIEWLLANRKSRQDIADQFPVTWNEYLKQTERTDRIDCTECSPE